MMDAEMMAIYKNMRAFSILFIVPAFFSLLLVIIPQPAHAGPRKTDRSRSKPEGIHKDTTQDAGDEQENEEERKKLARKIFEEAEKAYNLANFKEAMDLYQKAYSMLPLPGFLFNIGQCHRMLGDFEKAIFFYEGYLRRGKNIPDENMVRELIALCKEKQVEEKEKKLAEEKEKKLAEERIAASEQRDPLTNGRPETGTQKDLLIESPHKTAPSPFYKKWWFWSAVGGGVAAAVVTGLVWGLSGRTETVLPSGDLGTIDAR